MDKKKQKKKWPLIENGWEWLVASDPGMNRLRKANMSALGVLTTLLVELGMAKLIHVGSTGMMLMMILGAMLAMMGTNALVTGAPKDKARISISLSIATLLGLVAGIILGQTIYTLFMGYILVLFFAVYIRRFGMPFFFYGFLTWNGYFFASFLGVTLSTLPILAIGLLSASIWICIASLTFLKTNSKKALRRSVHAFVVHSRKIITSCQELMDENDENSRKVIDAKLHRYRARLDEAALIMEGWTEENEESFSPQKASTLRRYLINIQHAIDRMIEASQDLVDYDSPIRKKVSKISERLIQKENLEGGQIAVELKEGIEACKEKHGKTLQKVQIHAWRFAEAALEYVEYISKLENYEQFLRDAIQDDNEDFEPVISLAFGNLPGSPAVARQVRLGGIWDRLRLTTRQAIQVSIAGGLAIIIGYMISPQRYYWAAIASFVMFSGTSTQAETMQKGVRRIIGTLTGLFMAILLAHVTANHLYLSLAIIIVSIFLGNYLMAVSYTYMIFFITIMLGQLYVLMGSFSTGILLLRLLETSVGALVGFVVAILVVPLSTWATLKVAESNFLQTMSELLGDAAQMFRGQELKSPMDSRTRQIDNRLRQLMLIARPLTHSFFRYKPHLYQRLVLYKALATENRALAVAVREKGSKVPENVLIEAIEKLRQVIEVWTKDSSASKECDDILIETEWILMKGPVEIYRKDPAYRALLHMRDLLEEICG